MALESRSLNELIKQTDIVGIINEFQPIQKVKNGYETRCIYCQQTMNVYPKEYKFICHHCNTYGDVFNFVRKVKNYTFKEAACEVRRLNHLLRQRQENQGYKEDYKEQSPRTQNKRSFKDLSPKELKLKELDNYIKSVENNINKEQIKLEKLRLRREKLLNS